ncbi:G2/mitotic-specific cyclin-B3 isoform X2 [Syngnathus typhle]|uniref:G2/mitotic-specific cyclin-B3 isoform X2 n=1 Tax=Syngnathus typhle TaxID=161592 RepID=UPI002A69F545|nr:G2/mitotic-specific cyclin-B3 isoform X2 [Syngnathus typhle]XP_061150300.1 G2/mitotic-specific cyclin-B3 isoform X2 [Syngnathus typhle]
MPSVRGRRGLVAAALNVPVEQQQQQQHEEQEVSKSKRSTSPCLGVPKLKKRTALVDMTNAHKVNLSFLDKKKKKKKKQQQQEVKKTSSVSEKSQAEQQRSTSESTEGKSSENDEEEKEEAEEQAVCHVAQDLVTPEVPVEFDVDSENRNDCFMIPEYAKDIFDYLKSREEKFVLQDYMCQQPSINAGMRAILVDWLVEVQENFELYHETLYLAVKLTDHFLARTPIHRDSLQLVGSTAMLLASKFEERDPLSVDNFLYICDDAYNREQFLRMEASILQALSFDIGIPVAYHFLRRYAKCAGVGMDMLTLARYFSELSLMDFELVQERSSLLAAACLFLALLTKDLPGWPPVLQFHSGYEISELAPVVRKIYAMAAQPPSSELKVVRSKYSHEVFFRVASLPLVDYDVLEKTLEPQRFPLIQL